ncbi:EamA family transporter [Actinomadura sp. ATCC 31491]|uniref:EamA family transporter n=1 Tax=Actinomadura luzonensis TaxID=2805427 RepID=A0ABT0G0R2_9ACTN|nr:EamA family transporter [Actinomadura luzonensis]MCK2218199.1 EamA family transporter [Actinomadura luzonensis]
MSALLALAAAIAYGLCDFAGGLASRGSHPVRVLLLAQLAAAALLGALVLVSPGSPETGDVVAGAAAGALATAGGLLLWAGLARGPMKVAAPVSALFVAGVPLAAGLLRGERPGTLALAGALLALVAIVLVSRPGGAGAATAGTGRALAMAVAAGTAFGLFFVVLPLAHPRSGFVPLLVCYLTSAVIMTAALSVLRPARVAGGGVRLPLTAGALEAMAHVCYLLAARGGLLSIVAVLASLYPAATVLLARLVLRERFSRGQLAGLAAALAALCAMSLAGSR